MEKEKLLMDLHDGIGGITTNISILSELVRKAKDQESVGKLLATISQLSREGIAEVRGFMHSLDSRDLTWRTLAVELRNQGANMIKTHNIGFAIDADVQDITEQPGSLTWVNIFKIYKEALTNVIKHAKASEVRVGFRVAPEAVLLTIRDNGIGVNDGQSGGRGLSHMKTRAVDIGGTVAISNERGTAVRFMLPFPLRYPAEGMAIQ
ncbi:MAG TPA: ATP-binding protein [Nitrospirota bacterium]|nr:ATP-binding protein [Nitrospirota bacterium]